MAQGKKYQVQLTPLATSITNANLLVTVDYSTDKKTDMRTFVVPNDGVGYEGSLDDKQLAALTANRYVLVKDSKGNVVEDDNPQTDFEAVETVPETPAAPEITPEPSDAPEAPAEPQDAEEDKKA